MLSHEAKDKQHLGLTIKSFLPSRLRSHSFAKLIELIGNHITHTPGLVLLSNKSTNIKHLISVTFSRIISIKTYMFYRQNHLREINNHGKNVCDTILRLQQFPKSSTTLNGQ